MFKNNLIHSQKHELILYRFLVVVFNFIGPTHIGSDIVSSPSPSLATIRRGDPFLTPSMLSIHQLPDSSSWNHCPSVGASDEFTPSSSDGMTPPQNSEGANTTKFFDLKFLWCLLFWEIMIFRISIYMDWFFDWIFLGFCLSLHKSFCDHLPHMTKPLLFNPDQIHPPTNQFRPPRWLFDADPGQQPRAPDPDPDPAAWCRGETRALERVKECVKRGKILIVSLLILNFILEFSWR